MKLFANRFIMKDNKMKVLKKDSKAWALALKIAKRKYINMEPEELLDGERVRWVSIIRGNTWVNTLDELIDLERRTSRRKA